MPPSERFQNLVQCGRENSPNLFWTCFGEELWVSVTPNCLRFYCVDWDIMSCPVCLATSVDNKVRKISYKIDQFHLPIVLFYFRRLYIYTYIFKRISLSRFCRWFYSFDFKIIRNLEHTLHRRLLWPLHCPYSRFLTNCRDGT